MGNQLSSSSSGRTGKLVLAAGAGVAAAALVWKCHGFFRLSNEDDKKTRKTSNDSSQKTVPTFADFCALVVVMGTWRLWALNDVRKISPTGSNREQFTDMQSLPNQSMPTSIDSNSATGISQLQDEDCDSTNSHPKEIKIMTYNLCHPQKDLRSRMLAVTLLVQKRMPDVVLFQEATPQMHKILRSYRIWQSYKTVAEGSHNCIVFSKLPMTFPHTLSFSKGGELLITKTEFNSGNDLFIATSHLNRSIEKRMSQAHEAMKKLHRYPNIIFGGDMNWRSENESFPLKLGWMDAWEHIKPNEPGYTFDTKKNPLLKGRKMLRERLDRFMCKLSNFELVDIEIVGKEKISVFAPSEFGVETVEIQNQSVIVSDHYGLILTVRAV